MIKQFKRNACAQILAASSLLLVISACNQKQDTVPAVADASVGTNVDDSVITAKIKAALLTNENIKSLDITVTTSKGEVMLSGFVNNQSQIDISVNLAKGIQGVKDVNNQFTIKEGISTVGAKIDDDVITTKVKSALLSDALVKSFDISVVTRNGEVQLSGFVDNQSQITHSIDTAKSIEGVKSVLNHMTIKQ
jgi:hyperosmotically inducible protein